MQNTYAVKLLVCDLKLPGLHISTKPTGPLVTGPSVPAASDGGIFSS